MKVEIDQGGQDCEQGADAQGLEQQLLVLAGNQCAGRKHHEHIQWPFGQPAQAVIGLRPGEAEQQPGGKGQEHQHYGLAKDWP
ncbi:hypothetical protein D3C80_1407860 [compost metagenome]